MIKDDIEQFKQELRKVVSRHTEHIQDNHGVSISRIDVDMLGCEKMGKPPRYVLGEITVYIEE